MKQNEIRFVDRAVDKLRELTDRPYMKKTYAVERLRTARGLINATLRNLSKEKGGWES